MKPQNSFVALDCVSAFCKCVVTLSKPLAWRLRTACVSGLLPLLLLLAQPTVLQAQFTFVTNNGAITITGYTGPGGDVVIPSETNGLPVTAIGGSAFYMRTTLTSVTVPDSVISMGDQAFYYCTNLANVTIGNSVASIGNFAFQYCYRLTSVNIPNSVTSIGGSAFWACGGLTSITIPDSVATIGGNAFFSCVNLTNVAIGTNVTTIGGSAFRSCALTSVTIPSSVTNIGYLAFDRCANLTAITVDALNPGYSSLAGVLFNKGQTTLIQCPARVAGAYMIPNSVTNIEACAFNRCSKLTNITIPNTIINVGQYAFNSCSTLASIVIPDSVANIGDHVFEYCYNLTNAIIGNGLRSLGSDVFAYSGLIAITIPNSVTSLGQRSFAYCTNLTNITIGNSVTNIGGDAFWGCYPVTGVYFQGNAPSVSWGAFSGVWNAVVYYLPWTMGWSSTFAGLPTVIWNPQSLVQNGNFEAGAFTGWILVGNTTNPGHIYNMVGGTSSGFSIVHSGRYGAFLGDTQVATLSQSLSTIPGQYYLLSFWLNNPISGTLQLFSANWNSDSAVTNTLFSITNPPAFSWTNLQFLVSATGTNTTLQIRAENDPGYFGLDDITVTPVPLPIFQCPSVVSNSFQLSWATTSGMAYQVQYKTNLLQTNWINLTASFVATNDSATLLDTNAVSSSPQRFYRFSLRAP